MRRLSAIFLALTIGGSAAAMAADPPSPGAQIGQAQYLNSATSTRMVREGLRNLGYSNIRNLSCSGSICKTHAVFKGTLHALRIETSTGRIQSTRSLRLDEPRRLRSLAELAQLPL